MGTIEAILIAATPSSPMLGVAEARLVAGRGIEGDRYFLGSGTFSPSPMKPDFEITLIEAEAVEAYAAESGHPFSPHDARRNLVTRGVRLNDWVGKVFQAGSTQLRGLRLCEPCNYLAKITRPGVLKGLVHRGGLRAQIVTGGLLRVGDSLNAFHEPS